VERGVDEHSCLDDRHKYRIYALTLAKVNSMSMHRMADMVKLEPREFGNIIKFRDAALAFNSKTSWKPRETQRSEYCGSTEY
jgi:hypothetical protein